MSFKNKKKIRIIFRKTKTEFSTSRPSLRELCKCVPLTKSNDPRMKTNRQEEMKSLVLGKNLCVIFQAQLQAITKALPGRPHEGKLSSLMPHS